MSGHQYDDDANTFRLAGFFTMNAFRVAYFSQTLRGVRRGRNLLNRRIEVGRTPTLTLGQPQIGAGRPAHMFGDSHRASAGGA